jgi:Tol biopolymer transport system component
LPAARNARVIWTPDGKRVIYGSTVGGNENLFVRPADGRGSPEQLMTSPNLQVAAAWSPSDSALVFVEFRQKTGNDILAMLLSGDRRPRPIVETRFQEAYPDISPGGCWLEEVKARVQVK